MKNCCNICVDPTCGGKKNCNCDTCSKKDTCYRLAGLKPTIRITRKCTQSCSHCCFECSPKEKDMMSVEVAQNISRFCQANDITRCEIMGGEFYMNPDWETILSHLVMGMKRVRIVSNGDWAQTPAIAERVVKFMKDHPECYMGVSKDRWHTNDYVDAAVQYLKVEDVPCRVPNPDEIGENTLVPVGRSEWEMNIYGMMSCYCHNPEKRYNFLIDENGEIYKCGFGSWPYANVTEYQEGGFDKRFQDFNNVFYNAWLNSCAHCHRAEERAKSEDRKVKR